EQVPEGADSDPPAATRAYPAPSTRAARRAARRSAQRGRSVRVAALGTAFAAVASIVALVGSHSMTGPAESPARIVVDAPATPSPAPSEEQVRTTVQGDGTGSTAPATQGETAGVAPARSVGPGPAAPSNPNRGP